MTVLQKVHVGRIKLIGGLRTTAESCVFKPIFLQHQNRDIPVREQFFYIKTEHGCVECIAARKHMTFCAQKLKMHCAHKLVAAAVRAKLKAMSRLEAIHPD
jgi:hypothetical protein